jgi:hypothetical protein
VQALQSAEQLCGIEAGTIHVEALFALQMVEEFAAINESEDEVELLRRLEGELEGDDEGIVDLGEDGALSEGVCYFGAGDDVRLADCLERVDTVRIFLSGDVSVMVLMLAKREALTALA